MPDIALPITSAVALFASALILWLTCHVVVLRRKGGVVIGDNNDRVLAKAIRAQGNATEQLPIALILMGLAEFQGAPTALLFPTALILVFGRLMHATYFAIHGTTWRLRFYGMWLTVVAQALLIGALIVALVN